MKVKLLKPWIAALDKPVGSIVNVPDQYAEEGIEKGLCKLPGPDDVPVSKMNKPELEARAAELGVDLSAAKNNRERVALIQAKLEETGK